MKHSIIFLEEYIRNLTKKKNLDNGTISLADLSLEELDGVSSLYISEIKNINKEIEQRKNNIERLKQENSYLRKLVKGSDNQ